MRRVRKSRDRVLPRRSYGYSAGDVPARVRIQVFDNARSGRGANGVLGYPTGHYLGAVVLEQQERGCSRKSEVGVEHVEGDGMRLAVTEHACERREVHAIRNEVQGLNAGDWPPQNGSMPPV